MRTIILLAALSLARAAETCTKVSATASSGQCSGVKMSTKMCLPEGVSADTYSKIMVSPDPCGRGDGRPRVGRARRQWRGCAMH